MREIAAFHDAIWTILLFLAQIHHRCHLVHERTAAFEHLIWLRE